MLKQILVAFTALTAGSAMYAQTIILSEDFNGGIPSSWTIVKNDAFTEHPSVSEFAPGWISIENPTIQGDSVAAATSYFTTNDKASRWLISPPLTLGAFGNFMKWKAMSFDPSYPDTYQVLISVTDTEISSFIDTLFRMEGELDEWLEREVHFDEFDYFNQTVHVAFVIETIGGFKLLIDDVEVRVEDPLAIAESTAPTWGVFPNPTMDLLTVYGVDIMTIQLFNTAGQLVYSQQSNSAVSLRELEAGIYLCTVVDAKGQRYTKRIQKI